MESWGIWHTERAPLRLGVSACLLGERVRYDGDHRRDGFVVGALARWFAFVAVCPEVEIGLGVPRPPIRLETTRARKRNGAARKGDGGAIRLVCPSTGEDLTRRMAAFASRRVAALRREGIDGFILKSGSPSCGMARVKVHRATAGTRESRVARPSSSCEARPRGEGAAGRPRREGVGRFARELAERWPTLPVEDEERLRDPAIRRSFLTRIFARNRWRGLLRGGRTRRRLQRFHAAHELLLRAHGEAAWRRLGVLVARADRIDVPDLFDAYERGYQQALRSRPAPRAHARVMRHALGLLDRAADPAARREIRAAIAELRRGRIPLLVPRSLLPR